MASDHPFQTLFETLGRPPTSHAESVNRRAYEVLSELLTVPVEKTGRCILLRAPRAGHGKTHLLARIQHFLGSTHEFIPLHPAFGCRIDAASVTDDALRRLVRPLPASGGLCVLDLVTRRLFAAALQPLVGSGEVPCQDREGALSALRTRPIETFDFHHPNAVTAHWARENFEVLGQRLSLELAQRCGLPVREVAFWVDALFKFSSTPVENPNRVRILAESIHIGRSDDGNAMERLEALLGLTSLLMRVVLVADDLEGFSADESAALKLAAFLGSLRQSVERLDVILSVNQDIWESAFLPRLSGGLTDRLSEVVIELKPLTHEEMAALLDSRVPGLGSRVLERIDPGEAGTHARGLIRAAGMAWLKATAQDAAQPAANTPVAAVAPVGAVAESAPAVAVAPVMEAPPQSPEPTEPEPVEPEPVEVEPVAAQSREAESEMMAGHEVTAPMDEQPTPISTSELDGDLSSEAAPDWPAPEFSPDAAAPGPVAGTNFESSFQVSEPALQDESASQDPALPNAPELSDPTTTFATLSPDQAVGSFDEPPQPVSDSPFQVASEPTATPDYSPSPVESPFQPSGGFNPQPRQETFQSMGYSNSPPMASPFQPESSFNALQAEFEHQAAGDFNSPPTESPLQPSSEFAPAPASSDFLPDPPVFAPEGPTSPPFAPSNWQDVPVFNPPTHSPFQLADQEDPQDPPHTSQSENFLPQPTSFENPQTPEYQPAEQPEAPVTIEPVEPALPPSASDTDRVDELLRQFRERYGRGSL